MSNIILDSEIRYSRETRDYEILIAGQCIGFADTLPYAERIRTRALSERRDEGLYATASELDGGASDPGGDPIDEPADEDDADDDEFAGVDPDDGPGGEPWPDAPVSHYTCLGCRQPLPARRGGHCESCVTWSDDPWDDGPSQAEQAESAARWTECEGGWEQYTPHPFDPSKTVRLFQPRI